MKIFLKSFVNFAYALHEIFIQRRIHASIEVNVGIIQDEIRPFLMAGLKKEKKRDFMYRMYRRLA